MTEKPKRHQSMSPVLILSFAGLALAGLAVIFILLAQPRSCGSTDCEGHGPGDATPSDFIGITAIEPQAVADFTLTDQNGDPMSLSDMQGKPTLIFFGFTSCPNLCPTTLGEYRRIYETIGEDRVNFVFISIDGERDTPEVIKQYLETNRVPYVIGLTSDLDTVLKAGAPFNLVAEAGPKDASGNYDISHTSSIFFLNREGQLVARYAYGMLLEDLIKDIEARL